MACGVWLWGGGEQVGLFKLFKLGRIARVLRLTRFLKLSRLLKNAKLLRALDRATVDFFQVRNGGGGSHRWRARRAEKGRKWRCLGLGRYCHLVTAWAEKFRRDISVVICLAWAAMACAEQTFP